jgi:hypothetical protein
MTRSNKPKRVETTTANHVRCSVQLPIALVNEIDVWAGEHAEQTRGEAIRRLLEIGLTTKTARTSKRGQGARAATLAGQQIDQMGDAAATPEERASRKVRLMDGPSVFRSARRDRPKGKIVAD